MQIELPNQLLLKGKKFIAISLCRQLGFVAGVYANGDDVKKFLSEKYGNSPASELKDNKDFNNDLMEADICMTVRLQIVYSNLIIRSIRNAYEESVGSRLKKFGGSDNKELLQR